MSYLSSHKTRIRKRYNYSKGALEAGMIVELTYKRRVKKGDPSRLETKKYMAIVLDASHKGQMHAISLETVSTVQLNKVGVDWGLTLIEGGSAVVTAGVLTGERAPKLLLDDSPTGAYSSQISKSKTLANAYKTFNIKEIGNVAVCDYTWDKQAFNTLEILKQLKEVKKLESKAEQKEKKKEAEAKAKKPTNK